MRLLSRIAAAACAAVVAVTPPPSPLAAQERAVIVSVYAGGADHLADLKHDPTVWFNPGYNVGASLGYQFTKYLAVHADFTYTRNPALGTGSFAGSDVNRFFYGAHLEARYPLGARWAPFVFLGAGAVSVDQLDLDTFHPFTRGAGMVGGGMFYVIPRSHVELFGEVKGLTYKWNAAGFNRTMFDVTYSIGVSFRRVL
jgi:opacity protein-like surface antigen